MQLSNIGQNKYFEFSGHILVYHTFLPESHGLLEGTRGSDTFAVDIRFYWLAVFGTGT